MQERQRQLEEVVAHQQLLLDQLDGALTAQQRDLESLRRRLALLEEKYLDLLAQGSGGDLPHEKPPHY